jgi:hypothetical protein
VVPELKKLIVGSIPLRMAGTLVDMQLTALCEFCWCRWRWVVADFVFSARSSFSLSRSTLAFSYIVPSPLKSVLLRPVGI